MRGAGHGAAHTHRRRQLCRLLPGAEEDRGSGAERRSQGAHNHANRKTLPSIVQNGHGKADCTIFIIHLLGWSVVVYCHKMENCPVKIGQKVRKFAPKESQFWVLDAKKVDWHEKSTAPPVVTNVSYVQMFSFSILLSANQIFSFLNIFDQSFPFLNIFLLLLICFETI